MTAAVAAGFLPRHRIGDLIDILRGRGRRVIGPTLEQGAIVYDEVESAADLPVGWRDSQSPGRYRVRHDAAAPERIFANAVGPTAWKRFLFPPERLRMHAKIEGGRVEFTPAEADKHEVAFLGVRACDLAAMGVQDRVFTQGPHTDAHYADARDRALVVAVQCTHPADTCFCTSMGTGPEVRGGFDLCLTEIEAGFVVEAGSDAGREIRAALDLQAAADADTAAAHTAVNEARSRIETDNLGLVASDARHLSGLPQHPRWAEVAERCLACTNCTMVCPTCFCSRDVNVSELGQPEADVERHWDSCFTAGFGQVAGGNFRERVQDRYRQWLTHKFSNWYEQFDTTGCVGCGRCIVWCPVGIDVREEVTAITAGEIIPMEPDADTGPELHSRDVYGPGTSEMVPLAAAVIATTRETHDTVSLTIAVPDGMRIDPGQFVMATLPRIGAPPISVSRSNGDSFEITVRAIGQATAALCRLRSGDELGVAGPYGVGWPVEAAEGRDVIIVGGGIGLAPLRPVVDHVLRHRDRFGDVRIFVGARTPKDMPFAQEIADWELRDDVEAHRIVDRAGPDWLGPIGTVTQLFEHARWDGHAATAFVCGPEVMMAATVETLDHRGLDTESMYLTTERHMECGVGLCGHCQLGPFLICRDGPVFTAKTLEPYLGVEGI